MTALDGHRFVYRLDDCRGIAEFLRHAVFRLCFAGRASRIFTLMLFSLSAVASLSGKSLARGLLSLVLGLIIATIGIDLQSAAFYRRHHGAAGRDPLSGGVGMTLCSVGSAD